MPPKRPCNPDAPTEAVAALSAASSNGGDDDDAHATPQPRVARTNNEPPHEARTPAPSSLPPKRPCPQVAPSEVVSELSVAASGCGAANDVHASPPRPEDRNIIATSPVDVSPGGRNRQLFMAGVTPQRMTCDLTSAIVGFGVKHNLEAIIIATFPVQKGPPARKHIFVADSFAVTGITVWNADVEKFPKEVLGATVSISRASVSMYQGKKSLVLNKDSSVVVDSVSQSPAALWWQSLALQPPLPLSAACNAADNRIVNVFGVLAFVAYEEKEVNGAVRLVATVHLASQTTKMNLRGWDLSADMVARIEALRDQVVQVRRVRMTSYGGTKIGEILDSALGSIFLLYKDADLERFWAE